MAADHVLAAGAPLVDVAEPVDQVVVPDVTPAPRHRVVVVDGAHRYHRVLGVRRLRVVDDDLLDGRVLRGPDFAVGGVAVGLVRAPLGAGDDWRRGGGVRRGERYPRHVALPRPVRGVDVGEGQARDLAGRAVDVERPVLDEAYALREDERGEEAAVPLRLPGVLRRRCQVERLAVGHAVGTDAQLDHRPGADLTVPVGADGVEGEVAGEDLRRAAGAQRGGVVGRDPRSFPSGPVLRAILRLGALGLGRPSDDAHGPERGSGFQNDPPVQACGRNLTHTPRGRVAIPIHQRPTSLNPHQRHADESPPLHRML